MRIGIYDPYLDDLGGGEKYMMTIAQCLSKQHNVSIFWDKKAEIEAISNRFSLNLSKTVLVKNIFSPNVSSIQRAIQSKKYDCIIVLSDGSIPFVLSKKLFIHIQQPLEHIEQRSFWDKVKLSRVNSFFCNSVYTKSFLDARFGLKSVVVYPPVALHPKKLEKKNTILHVGRFRSVGGKDYKKQSVMVEVFKQMIDKGLMHWNFVIAVSVHEKDMPTFLDMQESAQGYPITFLINKSNEELWTIYSSAKIYWHASGYGEDLTKNPELAEHFGISTVEAMGAGVVPIVINSGGQKEIVQDGVNGMLWDSLEDLAKKTLHVITDEDLRKKLSKNAQISANIFNEDIFCENISSLIL